MRPPLRVRERDQAALAGDLEAEEPRHLRREQPLALAADGQRLGHLDLRIVQELVQGARWRAAEHGGLGEDEGLVEVL